MHKEIQIPNHELLPLIEVLDQTFIQRRDLYAKQLDDGRYICIHKPLRDWHLTKHLEGEITLGAYALDQDDRAKFIALDADDTEQLIGITHMASELVSKGISSYLENSRRGGHLWFFFENPVPGRKARAFGKRLIKEFRLGGIELFPKQPKLKGGPGSLIRLPFGIHQRSGERYGFLKLDGQSLAPTLEEQIEMLRAPECVPEAAYSTPTREMPKPIQKRVHTSTESPSGPLSQQIKDNISVLDFVSQYVELSPNNRGLCPFHDDHHASFSVNVEKNYWYCFAGCGGGSVIDFWMKWQDCDFTTSIRELAGLLLRDD